MKKSSDIKVAKAILYKLSRRMMPSDFYNKVASCCDIGEVETTRLSHYAAASAVCKV